MTSSAQNKSSWKWKHPRQNVAIVKLTQEYTAKGLRPAMISKRARGVLRVIHTGAHHVGATDRCAYRRALKAAEERAHELNNARERVLLADMISWGGSA